MTTHEGDHPVPLPHDRLTATRAASVLMLALLCVTGCTPGVPAEKFRDVQAKLLLAEEQVKRLESQLADQQETIRNLQAQIVKLRQIKSDSIDDLIVPVKIELERLSGGYDNDGKVGDDGIVLYVQPVDADGHIVKAAGTLDIELFDLQAPSGQQRIAPYQFDAKTTRSKWYGRMWTNHFTVYCPWPPGKPPAHDLVTANVVFTDLLTGRSLKAQAAYKIKFPLQQPQAEKK